MAIRLPATVRFWKFVSIEASGCWLWTGAINHNGYGLFHGTQRMGIAHRFAFEYFVGPIQSGLDLDHLCRNRACVNPAHLEPVPHRVNLLRGNSFSGVNARKTHCVHGHPFTPDNTRLKYGHRLCRICARGYKASARRRKSEAA